MLNFALPRLDLDEELREMFLPFCRIKRGETWKDKKNGHRVGCIDASEEKEVLKMMGENLAVLAVHDPPYNFVAFKEEEAVNFVLWCLQWVQNSYKVMSENSSLYVWLGADQNNHYQPFPEFISMMKESGFSSRSFITMRNQRGYGTQKNWMSVRQELLYYTKGKPYFNIEAEYTEIPKILQGYYKIVNGKNTENFERSKSKFIRAGNVWVDIQQIFYRMNENVNGCYAQKPLKAIQRIITSGSKEKETVLDFFSHSGTTLLASEILKRKCITADIDPVYCEITIRRLEHFRKSGKPGWQNSNPFAEEIENNRKIKEYLSLNYNSKTNNILSI